MSETDVAFARSCPRGVETLVAFARAGRVSDETVIAFAGEKWAFFVRFSVAEASSVSTLAVEGRAVVMAVSRWPASAAAEVAVVSTSPRGDVQCANKFAQRTKNDPNRRLMVCWANFVAGRLGRNRAGRVLSRHQSRTPTAGRPSSRIEQETDLPGPPQADGHEKALPKEC